MWPFQIDRITISPWGWFGVGWFVTAFSERSLTRDASDTPPLATASGSAADSLDTNAGLAPAFFRVLIDSAPAHGPKGTELWATWPIKSKHLFAARKVSEACLSRWLCLLMRGKSSTCRKRLIQLFSGLRPLDRGR